MTNKNTLFIEKAKQVHGNKYDYSKVEYINNHTKVCIICPEHGEFWQTPHNHVQGSGCPKCHYKKNGELKRLGKERFIEKANFVHGDKYDYSKVEYINAKTKVCIICPEHGEFWQAPSEHLRKEGCPMCGKVYRYNTDEFVELAKRVHGNKYDYSKVEYVNSTTKVCIICPEHGEFWQTPKHHLKGFGCRVCSQTIMDYTMFVNKANQIHGNKYDYSKVEYVNSTAKVCIICPEHGEFWQTPNSHLNGRGCPICKSSHLENAIKQLLDDNKIEYIPQYRNKKLLGKQSLDFYLPMVNIGIECQGEQHFIKNFYKKFGEMYCVQRLDNKKHSKCVDNGITLIYYLSDRYKKYMDPNKIYFTNEKDLLKYLFNFHMERKKIVY